jgi:integrase
VAALVPARLVLADDAFVFSPEPSGTRPWHPDHFTHAYRALADELGIDEPLKNLRHFNATQLLAAGVDLPTTAGRLGHSDGGATTLRVYASWSKRTDLPAAEQLAGDLAALRAKAAAEGESSPALRAPRGLARSAWPVAEVLAPVLVGSVATYQGVADGLRAAIRAGRLEGGDRMPTIKDVATHYGVAVSTAQRAMSLLGDEGAIVRSGHRWVVTAPKVAEPEVSTPEAPAV